MKAIKSVAAAAALFASFSAFGAGDLARELHQSDGYNPQDLVATGTARSGGSVDQAFIDELNRTDGNGNYGHAAAPVRKSQPTVGFDAELLKELRKTDGEITA